MKKEADYYDQDFDFVEYVTSLQSNPIVKHETSLVSEVEEEEILSSESQENNWNDFYQHHSTGKIYKPRRYLIPEFKKYLLNPSIRCIVEVGCGYGCTMFPILEALTSSGLFTDRSFHYIATDCSVEALQILEKHALFDTYRSQISTEQWNITSQTSPASLSKSPNTDTTKNNNTIASHREEVSLLLSIFTLSAVPPQQHQACFAHFRDLLLLRSGGTAGATRYLLFRDYGLYDFTMLEKHEVCLEDYFYRRLDGTLCYYFSLDYLRSLAEAVGMRVVELSYATVINLNRKTKEKMHRVFVHGVFAVDVC